MTSNIKTFEEFTQINESISKGDKVSWKDFRERYLTAFDKGVFTDKDNVWTVVGDSPEGLSSRPEVYIELDKSTKNKKRHSVPLSRLEKI